MFPESSLPADGGASLLQPTDWQALAVTLRLASATVLCLMLLSLPLAWWLARSRSPLKVMVQGLVALPLVLPPTVLGFYLLLALGPHGPIGRLGAALGLGSIAFSFTGLLVGSVVYSLPFVVQPLQAAFAAIDPRILESAATLGASPWDRFWSVVLPNARRGIIAAAVLGFAHTLGEFGVVFMLGGNMPGTTRVASIAIYQHVETLEYGRAHALSLVLVGLSLALLLPVHWAERHRRGGW